MVSSNRYGARPWSERDGDSVERSPVARAGDRETTKGEGLSLAPTSTKLKKTWGIRGIVRQAARWEWADQHYLSYQPRRGARSSVWSGLWAPYVEVSGPGGLVGTDRPCSGARWHAVSYGVALHLSRRHALESSTPPDLARTTRCIMRLLQKKQGGASVREEGGRRAGGLHAAPS